MDIERIKKLAFEKMGKRKPNTKREEGFVFYHGLRTAELALEIRKIIDEDDDSKDDIMYVAGLFHDIAKGIEPHSENGSVLAQQVLKDECTKEEIKEISEIIRLHNARGTDEEQSMEVQIIQDADLLDHMGTMEIWLNFVHQAFDGKSLDGSIEFYNDESYKDFLKRWRRLLNYDISRSIFDDREKFVDDFIDRMNFEGRGKIYTKGLKNL